MKWVKEAIEMPIARTILAEFNHEMANTRKVLERVPEEQAGWKPHPKSYSLGELAMHIANMPHWAVVTMEKDELDFDPPGGKKMPRPAFNTRKAMLEFFDDNVGKAVGAIADTSDDDMKASWALKNRGVEVFKLPRVAVLRSFVMNHMIHHRGQLTVYLRLKNVALPAIYGSSADEK
jgi:uncharacterized damage-inducible protein DinB